jgi:hypothetical protein
VHILTAIPPVELAALLVSICFAAGLNVYATLATLGLLARAGVIVLPDSLEIVGHWWVIGASGVLFALEFVADKIPAVDLIWNAAQTFVRVPVAALLAFQATSQLGLGSQLVAGVLGSVVAFAAHGTKLAARAAVTPSPEPLSNVGLSAVEDVAAVGLTWFASAHPVAAFSIVLVCSASLALMARWMWRRLRRARR